MDIFLKGLVHRFCPKIELFLIGVFYKNHIRKHRFWHCRKKRMILSRKKLKFEKGSKIDIFLKGLVYLFSPKIEVFLIGVFHRNSIKRTTFLILWKDKNDFKRKKIQVLKRAKKWPFSKGVSPWILCKNRTFSYRSFSQKICQKRSFLDILNRKQSF